MTGDQSIVELLFSPESLDSFLCRYLDKEPLHIRRNKERHFDAIFSIEQMDAFLARRDITFPLIRLVKNGMPLPLPKFTDTYATTDTPQVAPAKVFQCFNEGATIIAQLMKYTIPSLYQFVEVMEKATGFRTETNCYLTPADSRGFGAHYDNHHVLILQIHGSKVWKLYDTPHPFPLLDESASTISNPEQEPSRVITLSPGDLLYVPRGLVHDAATSGDTSLHITVALHPQHWIDLFRKGLKAEKNPELAKVLPLTTYRQDTGQFQAAYEQLLRNFLNGLNLYEHFWKPMRKKINDD